MEGSQSRGDLFVQDLVVEAFDPSGIWLTQFWPQVIVKALKTLEGERKCEIFQEMDGVKFF